MPKTLLIMRHAKSRWDQDGVSDHDRGLAPRGKADARRMGRVLLERGVLPDAIISSTAKRAWSTARLLVKICGYEGPLQRSEALYLQGLPVVLVVLRDLPEDVHRPMVVGHNPVLEELVGYLVAHEVSMPAAALACVDLPFDRWTDLGPGCGMLRFLIAPRDVR